METEEDSMRLDSSNVIYSSDFFWFFWLQIKCISSFLSFAQEFNFADFIDYAPEPKKMKFDDETLPETLLEPMPIMEATPIVNAINTLATARPDNFEQMLARIKEFHSQLNMEEVKGKSIEMFVCNICYEVYARTELLREHYITVRTNLREARMPSNR